MNLILIDLDNNFFFLNKIMFTKIFNSGVRELLRFYKKGYSVALMIDQRDHEKCQFLDLSILSLFSILCDENPK